MNISVIGGGNIGTLIAGELASKKHNITVFTSKPEKWSNQIEVFDEDENLVSTSVVSRVTDNLKCAVSEADLLFITYPANLFSEVYRRLRPFAKPGQKYCIVPGGGGAEFAFKGLTDRGCELIGLQRVHSIARLKEYGKSVYMLGRKPSLSIASVPNDNIEENASLIHELFNIPVISLSNYLSVTLVPSNSILHTSRLYSMFKDYKDGMKYPKNFLFYEEWNEESSEIMLNCDSELQRICEALPFDMTGVKALKIHYESKDSASLTSKIRSIKAFKGLLSPMKEISGEWIPDKASRYFCADFSFGLKIIRDIAELYSIDTPNIQSLWDWYTTFNHSDAEKAFSIGDISKKDFESMYK